MNHLRRSSKKGFTLAEVLVSMFVLSSLSLALVMIYRSGLTEFHQASGRISMQTQSRLIVDKLIFFLSAASKPPDESDPVPTPVTNGTSDDIRFVSYADLMNDGSIGGDIADDNYRTRVSLNYRVFLDTADDNRPLKLVQTTQYNGVTPVDLNYKQMGSQVLQISFARPQSSAIEVQLTVSNYNAATGRFVTGDTMRRYQGAPRSNINTYQMDSAIQLPVFSL